MNQFGQMNMQLSPMGPRQTPPLQHPGQLSQAGAMNQVSAPSLQPWVTGLLLLSVVSIKSINKRNLKINQASLLHSLGPLISVFLLLL